MSDISQLIDLYELYKHANSGFVKDITFRAKPSDDILQLPSLTVYIRISEPKYIYNTYIMCTY